MDADKFLNVGIDGFRSNDNRNYGIERLLAGIVESGILENESLALRKANGDSRVYLIADCAQSPCDYPYPVDYLDDFESLHGGVLHWFEWFNVTHGTSVASVLAADFRLGQADGNSFGDPTYVDSPPDLNHCPQWENASTGMAPGAAVVFSNAYPDSISAYTRSYSVMRNNHVDVLNLSHDIGTGCSISSSNTHEDELENGYDDGITIVAAAGNKGGGENCNLAAPADTPKVIAVSSLYALENTCQTNYQQCVIDNPKAATGGMNATINGTTYTGIIAGVDLVAPEWISNITHAYDRNTTPDDDGPWPQTGGQPRWPVGWNHSCNSPAISHGSSIAAPHVTGLALLLKHWQLNWGNTMFNSPGRLQALLLAMADRWDPDLIASRVTGISKKSGFGRIKLRYLGNSNFAPRASNTFAIPFTSGSPNVANWVWPSKMPVGTNFVKCVMFEPEDMSAKSDISDLYLQVNLKSPDASGLCSTSSTLFRSRSDNSRDIRHMVAHIADVAGKCVEYQIIRRHVTPTGSTIHLFCYYSSHYDYEDVAD